VAADAKAAALAAAEAIGAPPPADTTQTVTQRMRAQYNAEQKHQH
jgi:hypothetical protein